MKHTSERLDATIRRAADMADLVTTMDGARALAEEMVTVVNRAFDEGRLTVRLFDLTPDTALRLAGWLEALEGRGPLPCEVEAYTVGATCGTPDCPTCARARSLRCTMPCCDAPSDTAGLN